MEVWAVEIKIVIVESYLYLSVTQATNAQVGSVIEICILNILSVVFNNLPSCSFCKLKQNLHIQAQERTPRRWR